MSKILQADYVSQQQQEQIYRYMPLQYIFSFSIYRCTNEGLKIFSFQPIDITISSEQLPYLNTKMQNKLFDNLEVDIIKFTLPSNQISTINVTANLSSDPSINTTVTVSFKTLIAPISVSIDGGSHNQADYKNEYKISAIVRDYEIEDLKNDQGISLKLVCEATTYQFAMSPCKDFKGPKTFIPYCMKKFTLLGSKDTREQYFSTLCLFTELDIPPLQVMINEQSTYNLNEDIVAEIVYSKPISSDLLSYAGALLYENEIEGAIKFDFHTVRFRLWDYFSNLKKDQNAFQIRFSAYNPYYVMPSLNIKDININFPPSNCKFSVQPQEGKSLITSFNLVMSDCFDLNQSITYQFFYYNNYDDYLQELKNPYNILR
ncbi:hypothetical protein ABPG72_001673 [Tetrahymena utriculariae]